MFVKLACDRRTLTAESYENSKKVVSYFYHSPDITVGWIVQIGDARQAQSESRIKRETFVCSESKPLTDVASKWHFLLAICSLQGVASISNATATCGITCIRNGPLATVYLQ